ncbi:unnamed protein product [Ectocarpus fasciculatus]
MVNHRTEEEATIVIDVGSSSAKAGFSGEDMPRAVCPSVAEDLHLSAEELSTYRARRPESRECYLEYGNTGKDDEAVAAGDHPVRRGVLRDIDEMEKLMDNLFNFELAAYAGAHTPVLMVEPPLNERSQRQEMAAMMFETFKVPALSVCNSSVLALFASGRTRGLALEVGGGVAHAVPVFEGFALNHAVLRLEGAGQDITNRLKRLLEERGHHLPFDTVRDVKESLCYIPTDRGVAPGEDEYELPDGNTVTLDSECRSQAAELIFNPDAGGKEFAARATDGGLASMVMQSISMCDKDINPDLLGSVVVAGGTTMMPGFVERLQEDLDRVSPPGASMMASVIPHPTSHEPGYNAQRKHAPWIGGSMLASLSPFKQLQVTRQEYEDSGESIIHRIFL